MFFKQVYSSCFEIPVAGYASVASRSGCSEAKPIAHTGFGINVDFAEETTKTKY
ncbi:MAG: hypothetical protein LBJ00_04315 [Planctomycetaceae bacterium]|nr:hypothetical protein [Planctomycetaceae bacterium]